MRTHALRTAAVAMFAVVVVLLSWTLLARGGALALAKTSPELALRFHGADPEALVRINETETNPVVKARRARQVLAQRPLDGRAYRQLAEIEQAAGRPQAAATLFRVALRNTPRDRLSQAWMADDALVRGATADVVERLTLLLDMDATLWPGLFPYLRSVSLQEGAWAGLIGKLATEPPWRSQYLSAWAQESPANFDAAMLALDGAGASLTAAEREVWVQHLIGRQRWIAAYMAWMSGHEVSRQPERTGVFNGGFEMSPAGHFDWRLVQGGGSRKNLLPTDGAGGERALRIQFLGQPGADVEQVLLLPSGPYEFHARARLDGLRSERGLVWTVRCLHDQAELGTGPILRGSRPWHSYRFDFHVPEGCSAQHLTLELPGRTTLERRIEGVAWFDDVSVAAMDQRDLRPPESDAWSANSHATAAAADPAGRETPGVTAALVVHVAGDATVERQGRATPATSGALLRAGDRVVTMPPGTVSLRWRDDCELEVAAAIVALASPCSARRRIPPAPAMQPRAQDIVRASLAKAPGARGSSGADLPVGP